MYILEGNTGVGKSTFLQLLKKQMPWLTTSLEQVDNWQQEVDGSSLLKNFYDNPERWAFTFETMTMMSRIQEHLEKQTLEDHIMVLERSIYSGHHCFARNSYEQQFMSRLEWDLYQEWFEMLTQNKCLQPQGFIYLRVEPEIACERIIKRNRSAEKANTLEYVQQIHDKYERLFVDKKEAHLKNVPVLILDCNEEFEKDRIKQDEHFSAVQRFINTTHPSCALHHATRMTNASL